MTKTTYHLVALFDYWSWGTCAIVDRQRIQSDGPDTEPNHCRSVLCGSSEIPWNPATIEEALTQADGHLNEFYHGCCFRRRAHVVLDATEASWYALVGRDERKFVQRHTVGHVIAPMIAIHGSAAIAMAALPRARFTVDDGNDDDERRAKPQERGCAATAAAQGRSPGLQGDGRK